jgi:hypothetical protein
MLAGTGAGLRVVAPQVAETTSGLPAEALGAKAAASRAADPPGLPALTVTWIVSSS